MTVLDGIARHLHAQGVATYRPDGTPYQAGEVGVYHAGMPADVDRALVLETYPGLEPDDRNAWDYPRMQVRVRGRTPLEARDLDRAAYLVLHPLGPVTLTDPDATQLQDCHALQSSPQPLGQDQQGRWEYVRNYQLHTAR